MIRRTLARTKKATYAIHAPFGDGPPRPLGTGFFVHPAGWMLTAYHVVDEVDPRAIWLMQRPGPDGFHAMLQWPELTAAWPEYDLALMKVDFARNADKEHLKGLTGFPHLEVSVEEQQEGTPVYAYGYPLSLFQAFGRGGVEITFFEMGPRTTSAIVASAVEYVRAIRTKRQPRMYVIDKALNYGNSGGPIVLQESGMVFALCSRFQPVEIPQPVNEEDGKAVWIPSLYGVASSLSNIAAELNDLGD